MADPQAITHVIYDLDGTLLDTEPFFIGVQREMLVPFGRELDLDVRAQMLGRPNPVAARIFVEGHDIPMTPEAFLAERTRRLAALFPTARPCAGAVELTRHLAAHGVPQAVATSSDRDAFALKTRRHGEWFTLFDAIVTLDDVAEGKPAPDIFLEAAARICGSPEQCLVFEDAPIGVQAARAAGMRVIALAEPHNVPVLAGADRVLSSLEAFTPEEWGLPPLSAAPR